MCLLCYKTSPKHNTWVWCICTACDCSNHNTSMLELCWLPMEIKFCNFALYIFWYSKPLYSNKTFRKIKQLHALWLQLCQQVESLQLETMRMTNIRKRINLLLSNYHNAFWNPGTVIIKSGKKGLTSGNIKEFLDPSFQKQKGNFLSLYIMLPFHLYTLPTLFVSALYMGWPYS